MTPGRRLHSVLKKACFGSFFQVMRHTGRLYPCGRKFGGERRKKRWTWQQAEHGHVLNGAKVRGMRGNIDIYM